MPFSPNGIKNAHLATMNGMAKFCQFTPRRSYMTSQKSVSTRRRSLSELNVMNILSCLYILHSFFLLPGLWKGHQIPNPSGNKYK